MDKNEKSAFIWLFTSDLWMRRFDPRVLVSTTAANHGIDQDWLLWVLRFGAPRCIINLLQERGRNACLSGQVGMFVVFVNWQLFSKLLLSILVPPANKVSDEPNDISYVNSMIEYMSNKQCVTTPTPQPCNTETHLLTRYKLHNNMVSAYENYIGTMNFLYSA